MINGMKKFKFVNFKVDNYSPEVWTFNGTNMFVIIIGCNTSLTNKPHRKITVKMIMPYKRQAICSTSQLLVITSQSRHTCTNLVDCRTVIKDISMNDS